VNLPSGNYNLTITITQSNGQPDVPATNNSQTVYFVVLNATGFPLPFFQGFEIGVFPQNNMTIFNPNNNITWELTDTASALGTKSVVIRNFNNTPIGSIDELRMPMLDFSNTIQPKIEFDYAYTSFTSGASDTLEVLVSTDCGRNYQVVGLYLGGSLVTAPASTSYFVPNELQWKHKTINLLPYAGEPAVRISFRNKNSHENNLYLDNLNIYGASTGISGTFAEAISVFPNPAISAFTLSYLATDKGQLAANLSDITGRVVAQYSYDYNQGNNQWEIPVQNLPSGVYLLTLDQGDAHLTLRIMVQ
jgi:hypothetical protein